MIKVMIVEDDLSFLNRSVKIVAADPDFELVAAVRDGASARESLARGAPDVLLVDLGLPDVSGVEIIRETARRYPETDILVVTVFGDEAHVLASIEAGATGYLLKDSLPEEFIGVIKELRAGGSPISPRYRPPTAQEAASGRRGHGNASRGSFGAVGAGVRDPDPDRQGIRICRDRGAAEDLAAHGDHLRQENLPEARSALARGSRL